MCGIAGFLAYTNTGYDFGQTIRRMTDTIAARGPDSSGHWIDTENGIALGHRRLSILELSEKGAQPMSSTAGDLVLSYNGEIYNFLELKKNLQRQNIRVQWRGDSDTEVLLACFENWGVEKTLQQVKGMFAFALWDRKNKTLKLGRDRFGEKPLYFGWQNQGGNKTLLFGSDLNALRKHPSFEGTIDPEAVQLLTSHLYIPAPWSIYKSVRKLMPGTTITIDATSPEGKVQEWWNLVDAAVDGQKSLFRGTDAQAISKLDSILGDSVERQFVSEVPIGAFLSGGIDSSAIVALMQKRSSGRVKTFTIGFEEKRFNEADHAEAVAEHLGTDHYTHMLRPQHALDIIPDLCTLYSEPFADSSQIPTSLLSRFAREKVTVALSGDGGDEVFGGYNRYKYVEANWRRLEQLPMGLRQMMAKLLLKLPVNKMNGFGQRFLPNVAQSIGDKAHKASDALTSKSLSDLYIRLISPGFGAEEVFDSPRDMDIFKDRRMDDLEQLTPVARMMALDGVHYLPDDILAKVDRASMAFSLETRVPYLDPEVFEFAMTLKPDMRIRDGQTKWLLRQVLYNHVPQTLLDRPKVGFGVPIGDWLRGPLKEWAEDTLYSTSFGNAEGIVVSNVHEYWREHQKGNVNLHHKLWPLLMYASWSEDKARLN